MSFCGYILLQAEDLALQEISSLGETGSRHPVSVQGFLILKSHYLFLHSSITDVYLPCCFRFAPFAHKTESGYLCFWLSWYLYPGSSYPPPVFDRIFFSVKYRGIFL